MNEHSVVSSVTVGHVTLLPIVTVPETSTIRDCAAVLARTGVDLVAVDTHPLLVVTRDAVTNAIVGGIDLDATAIAITTPPVYVSINHPLVDVIQTMAARDLRGALVVNESGAVAGALAFADAVAVLLSGPQWLGALRVALHIESSP